MKIPELIARNRPMLSFEVFPPKRDMPLDEVTSVIDKLSAVRPAFISVTYGAGGGASVNTRAIAAHVLKRGIPALAHLTCITSTHEHVREELAALKAAGVENVLALRGDRPADGAAAPGDFAHANELMAAVREMGGFAIGGACYPECHPECAHLADDIENLKRKVDAGVEFLTTQMFFDNNIFYRYLAKVREAGVTVPIVAGVMPVTNGRQIKRICQLSGTYLPSRFKMIVDRFGERPDQMFAAGIAYATEQIVDLFANGVTAVHVYTMNRPEIGTSIRRNLGSIVE